MTKPQAFFKNETVSPPVYKVMYQDGSYLTVPKAIYDAAYRGEDILSNIIVLSGEHLRSKAPTEAILEERKRQVQRFGLMQDLPLCKYICLLSEELGEAAKEINDYEHTPNDINLGLAYTELAQVGALVLQTMEKIDHMRNHSDKE
jgi:hypothetical protein